VARNRAQIALRAKRLAIDARELKLQAEIQLEKSLPRWLT
jgi:DNA repair protein RadA/Sms